jgi:uncharacterized protein DUF1858
MSETNEINPQTKVADLLKSFPKLESVLIEIAPVFKKIQNPLLRKTVAKIATLEKAAEMAGIPVARLVGTLRRAAGLPEMTEGDSGQDAQHKQSRGQEPDWVGQGTVKEDIDADKMLDGGTHPLNLVTSTIEELEAGEMIRLTSSFPPIPLVEAVKKKGNSAFIRVNSGGSYETFFKKQ